MKETTDKRSQIMRAVKSKNTAPELLVRKLIYSLGYRYRLHSASLPGKPDIIFTNRKKAIFIHGCFWHGHDCKRGDRIPATNTEYWLQKIEKNKARDIQTMEKLIHEGWAVLILWECELKKSDLLKNKVINFLSA
ncbi:very short patch repair endonuclease [Mucilaginibacter pocheonensis]|uniref:Very short patch repair endonuclease n=1 Tax=Mucilaginibacter pocheonensis TaxID=398050 RepID=A0ABU1T9K1_9SPHI|nr:very short patch repair endonuclease [Mucilaginibacter pocheonensis]MDR6941885.1 DNA mismatch endonuclease (patch repair protein) [Mucilaginibacter pocheonensis]